MHFWRGKSIFEGKATQVHCAAKNQKRQHILLLPNTYKHTHAYTYSLSLSLSLPHKHTHGITSCPAAPYKKSYHTQKNISYTKRGSKTLSLSQTDTYTHTHTNTHTHKHTHTHSNCLEWPSRTFLRMIRFSKPAANLPSMLFRRSLLRMCRAVLQISRPRLRVCRVRLQTCIVYLQRHQHPICIYRMSTSLK